MNFFLITFGQIFELFLLILLGALLWKLGLIFGEAKKSLSGILINLVIPAVILNSFQAESDTSKLEVLLEAFLLSVAAHLLLIFLSSVFIPKKNNPQAAMERLCAAYTNAGFMGIPLLTALFDVQGAFYASIYVTVFHLFLWTHGVYSLSRGGEEKGRLKKLLSPTVMTVGVSLVLYLLGIRLPRLIMEPVQWLAGMNTPLAMLVTGASLASCGLGALFENRRIFYVTALRNLILPAILVLLFKVFGLLSTASVCVLIAACCPTAAVIPMIALQYGQDEQRASGIFAMTTVLSLFTIPLFMFFV